MQIGFWNIDSKEVKAGRDMSDSIVQLILEKDLDILSLAEANANVVDEAVYKLMGMNPASTYTWIPSSKDRIKTISRIAQAAFTDISGLCRGTRWSAYQVKIPKVLTFNIILVHLQSKMNWSDQSQSLDCVNLASDIKAIEAHTGSSNSIVLGDFNMNPFEFGMVAANGLHAMQDLNYVGARLPGREVDGALYKFFYNPMWNLFGDNKKPMGTCYYRVSQHVSYEWNLFDQVLVRPELKGFLAADCVDIVDSIGGDSLTKGFDRPDRDLYSDHLPIVLKLTHT